MKLFARSALIVGALALGMAQFSLADEANNNDHPGMPGWMPGQKGTILPGQKGVVLPGQKGTILPGQKGTILPGQKGVVKPGVIAGQKGGVIVKP